MMKNTQPFVAIIIPTLGRSSLQRAIDSLNRQTDKDWTGLVMFDGIKSPKSPNKKIQFFDCEKQRGAGSVRNQLLELFYQSKIMSKWIAFLDDDDEFKNTYVEKLKTHSKKDVDVVLFSFLKGRTSVPSPKTTELIRHNVGISYAVRTTFLLKHTILFEEKRRMEDYEFIHECEKQGANVFITHDEQYIMNGISRWRKPDKEHCYQNNIKFM